MSDKHGIGQDKKSQPKADPPRAETTSQYFRTEQEMIEYWKKNKIFERSVEERSKDKQWNFLDGPPFITGLPHYGTLLSSIPKDAFPRYKTMRGYRVRRVWGWDCHGLPAENKVENALGLKSKREIEEKVGVKKFIDECKLYVNDVSSAWEWYIDHVGRWVDFENSYRTMDRDYMESVMWVFKQMYEKGYIYKGLRVSLFCPHCSTPISNFEVAMDANENYKEVTEPANTYKYKLVEIKSSGERNNASLGKLSDEVVTEGVLRQVPTVSRMRDEVGTQDDKPTYFLAWSTTPWTKLTTTALAVSPELIYVTVEYEGERYILAESTLEKVFTSVILKQTFARHPACPDPLGELDSGFGSMKESETNSQNQKAVSSNEIPDRVQNDKVSVLDHITIVDKKLGKEMIGMHYEGHYDFYKPEVGKKLHVIVADDFVTADEGTGIVTLAPYGEEDLKVMQRDNIQIVRNVNDEGKLTPNNPNGWGGVYLTKVNPLVNEDLTKRGLMFHEDPQHRHTIAHCWRCHTRLFFNPQEAWYVDVQKLKPIMRETNENVNWFPSHFKYGRFLKSMEGAPDWCISRSRYWGSPVPVWECECGERFVPGSIAELEARSGSKIADLHKPDIDDVTLKCKKCSKTIHRVPEVLDSWIEAGSAAFAERHFPFDENGHELSIQKQQEYLQSFFPPDFISEYTGQIRAWFYVLHVIAAALYHKPAFKNVLVSGVILGTDGRKMSKNYKNYPDPKEVIEKYGGDALRLYLLGSPITKAEDINISEQEYKDQLRKFIIPLLNIWNFFETYAQVDNFQFSASTEQGIFSLQTITGNNNVLDKWLLSRLNSTVRAITDALEQYDTSTAVAFMGDFVNDWSKWHVRRSRDRVGTGELTEDANEYYQTTAYVFERFLRAIAPIVPFHSEYLYRKLTKEDSVHLQSWPDIDEVYIHPELEANTATARQICEIGHQIRKTNSWKVRHPLAKLEITIDADCSTIQENIWKTVLEELNVKNVVINGKYRYPYTEVVVTDEELKREGELRDLLREIQAMRKEKGVGINEKIQVILPEKYADYIEEVKTHIKTNTVTLGQGLDVSV